MEKSNLGETFFDFFRYTGSDHLRLRKIHMKLYPSDLGGNRTTTTIWRRANRKEPSKPEWPAAIGFWAKLWMGKTNAGADPFAVRLAMDSLNFPGGALALSAVPVCMSLITAMCLHPNESSSIVAPLFLVNAAVACLSIYGMPSFMLKRRYGKLANTPLTAMEIATLLPEADDDLVRAYLTLVMDVVRRDVEPLGGTDLRSALRALGEAIDKLPATRAIGIDSPDIMTEVLRRTAEETLKQAQTEPDRVVGASLVRRAESMHRRADATSRANLLSRRFMVLRQEMAAETEALRAGLAAYYTGAHDIADLTRLAQDVQRVAAEAAAITQATEEVDEALQDRPIYRPTAADPATLQMQSGIG